MGYETSTIAIIETDTEGGRDNRTEYGGEGERPLVWPLLFFKYIYFLRNARFTGLTRTKRERNRRRSSRLAIRA